MIADVICYWKMTSFMALDSVTSFLRLKDVTNTCTGPCSAVGNVSGHRCESDCRSRGREFDPSPVPYFRGD